MLRSRRKTGEKIMKCKKCHQGDEPWSRRNSRRRKCDVSIWMRSVRYLVFNLSPHWASTGCHVLVWWGRVMVVCRKCGARFIQLSLFGMVHPVRVNTLTDKGQCPECKSMRWCEGNKLSDKARERCIKRNHHRWTVHPGSIVHRRIMILKKLSLFWCLKQLF